MLVRILLESWSHLPINVLRPGELAARHWQRLALSSFSMAEQIGRKSEEECKRAERRGELLMVGPAVFGNCAIGSRLM